jgi:curved DNA-binding protein
LGLATTATFDEVKKQFRKLALKYHPDKCKNKKVGEKKFKEIFEAYETIKNSVAV